MIPQTESEEKQYLEEIKVKLQDTLEEINSKVSRYAKEIRDQKAYLWENKTGMDHVEKISVRQSVDQFVSTAEAVRDKGRRIRKLLASPYFGRFDFIKEGLSDPRPIYIGIHSFFDEEKSTSLIHDWRAPISTMFYDYETGQAQFEAPGGIVKGDIVLKRQYRIRKGQMEFMLESSLNIHDDILQKELSLSSDDKMKNIVATIQRDQNAIIRNENSNVLIIQGVAGSGKTSIALHRIAFLLYRFKETISSKDILIISPNKVFADYISNVLPELGEETIPEMGIEQLARDLLGYEYKFQTFFEQVTHLLEKDNSAFKKRIQFKATQEFFHKLCEYVTYIEAEYFTATDLTVNGRLVPAWFMDEKFKAYPKMPLYRRLEKIAKDIETNISIYYHYNITADERAQIKAAVKKMFRFPVLKGLYKDFYAWMEQPDMCKLIRNSLYEYSDVFPMIYLKLRCEGIKVYDEVRHLLVDEMQDYTPVQYEVIAMLFECKKTILGDANQSVNPFSSSSSVEIQKVFNDADCVKLCKSYRSTYEITEFAQNISANKELEAVERHGEQPALYKFDHVDEEIDEIKRLAQEFKDSDYQSMGIICKTQQQAQLLHEKIQCKQFRSYLLNSQSEVFRQGIVVLTAHMAKGLEFDHVVVPHANADNYRKEVDQSMLYVACTRAMHRLTVTYTNNPSSFLKRNIVV